MQLDTDIRTRFANVIESQRQAEQDEETRAAAHAPAQPNAAGAPRWLTNGRVELVRKMLAERYPAQEAAERFAAIKWDGMTMRAYQAGIDRLKSVPRIDRQARPVPAETTKVETKLFDGYFTVVLDEENYRTIRVRTQDAKANFKPGEMILGYLNGQDNYSNYQSFGHVDSRTGRIVIWKKHRDNEVLAEVVKVLEGDVRAAAQAYFKMSRNCVACGTMITKPESIADAEVNGGLGPICKDKASW